ncbi:MAG: hypothetical protein NTY81_01365 [Candidatus Staskawiczbacteria bacterium]|nr:hypothetical protein [Candidatus Staskawiczbacteria bacterium]
MAKKNITINDLATMVQRGFNGVDERFEKVATKEQVGDFEKWTKEKINKIENRLEKVEKKLISVDEKISDAGKLETRVDYLENVLALPNKK